MNTADYRDFLYDDPSDRMRELWIETRLEPADLLALKAASQLSDFELVGLTDLEGRYRGEMGQAFENWGLEMTIASPLNGTLSAEGPFLEREEPAAVLGQAMKDLGGLDILFFYSPSDLEEAVEASREAIYAEADPEEAEKGYGDEFHFECSSEEDQLPVDQIDYGQNIDNLYFALGQPEDFSHDSLISSFSRQDPLSYHRALERGHQRFLLDPRLALDFQLPGELEDLIRKTDAEGWFREIGEKGTDLSPLLLLYLYERPQAFALEEKSVGVQTAGRHAGRLQFEEGSGVFLATAFNEGAFQDWLTDIFKGFE